MGGEFALLQQQRGQKKRPVKTIMLFSTTKIDYVVQTLYDTNMDKIQN